MLTMIGSVHCAADDKNDVCYAEYNRHFVRYADDVRHNGSYDNYGKHNVRYADDDTHSVCFAHYALLTMVGTMFGTRMLITKGTTFVMLAMIGMVFARLSVTA